MRSMLASLLFIMAVVVIYNNTISGENGAKQLIKLRGGQINDSIERINP
jgi:hypothetical protein